MAEIKIIAPMNLSGMELGNFALQDADDKVPNYKGRMRYHDSSILYGDGKDWHRLARFADITAENLADNSITNDKLVNKGVTIGSTTINLGETRTSLSGLASLAFSTGGKLKFSDSVYFELTDIGVHLVGAGFYTEDFLSAGGYSETGTGGGGGASALYDLNDVNVESRKKGDLLSYDGSHWVNITQSSISPDLSGYIKLSDLKVLDIKVGGVSKGKFTATSGLTVDITAADLGLTAVMKYEGVTTSEVYEGATTNPVTVEGVSLSAYKGMVVSKGVKEFFWTGSKWREYGDEGSFALKTITITGTGYLTGGGDLTQNSTIDITQTVKDKINHGETAYGWGDWSNEVSTLKGYFNDGVAKEAEKVSNGLTFTGYQSKTFDGSSAVSVAIPSALADLADDKNHKLVTEDDIKAWNALVDMFEMLDGAVHVKNNMGFYSDSFISSGGKSDTGTEGSGSFNLLLDWGDSYDDTYALGAGLGVDLKNRVATLESRPVVPSGVLTTSNYASTLDSVYWRYNADTIKGVKVDSAVNADIAKEAASTSRKLSFTGASTQSFNGSQDVTVNIPVDTWRPLGTGANDACAGNDARLSDARPASDVYAWAKKSSLAFSDMPGMYIGTTTVQSSSKNQAVTGVTSITLTNGTKTLTLELDSDGDLKVNGTIYATGNVSSGGKSNT